MPQTAYSPFKGDPRGDGFGVIAGDLEILGGDIGVTGSGNKRVTRGYLGYCFRRRHWVYRGRRAGEGFSK